MRELAYENMVKILFIDVRFETKRDRFSLDSTFFRLLLPLESILE